MNHKEYLLSEFEPMNKKSLRLNFLIIILSVILTLAISQLEMMYKLRYSKDVFLKIGFPFDYYYFSYNELHGFDLKKFILDVTLILIVIHLFKKLIKLFKIK